MNWEHEYIQKQAWGRLAIGGLAAGGAAIGISQLLDLLKAVKKNTTPAPTPTVTPSDADYLRGQYGE